LGYSFWLEFNAIYTLKITYLYVLLRLDFKARFISFMERVEAYKPQNKVRIVTAASLFDGHDAAINIMRRIIQATGCEVIHLGRSGKLCHSRRCASNCHDLLPGWTHGIFQIHA